MMKSPNAQDWFRPMPGLISCAGVTGSGHITYHAYATLLSGICYVYHQILSCCVILSYFGPVPAHKTKKVAASWEGERTWSLKQHL